MSNRKKILSRRESILDIVKSGSFTVKDISKKLKVSTQTVVNDVHAMDCINWKDCVLYYGVKL